ncbi:helix-turn-helix transcriptional regulator [Streptomyces niveus]|uniref:helix-turn-helix transcriptional regulator n=1 Tax=Streptomyces niveus TaxID=193462 RepID=UPI00084CC6C3|nr:helix-turn-helix domain-containing protein [Streptomyces niveus]
MTEGLAERIGQPQYLTSAEVAERYRIAESTIRYWRQIGYGPAYMKAGRQARYSLAALAQWDAEQAGGRKAA